MGAELTPSCPFRDLWWLGFFLALPFSAHTEANEGHVGPRSDQGFQLLLLFLEMITDLSARIWPPV